MLASFCLRAEKVTLFGFYECIMIGVKMNTFNDNSGEPEQDANSALTELDKGLRSGKVGEQCEAIVRFPRLFEKYPFPILINSSFLKLADIFRMGNNFLRLWVLRVCQQSEKHLDKILNVDEFLRRVFSVLHSNDPVARALALRTLGAVAGIIPERQNVHHAIRRGLDSHDNVEVDAAIYATMRFAAHSNAFAVGMSNKLSEMVECESTAADRRVKLVRALRTVHGGALRAQGVLKLLHLLLEKYPSTNIVRAAISAVTHIAADTVVHVPDQVELLLNIASTDPRGVVRRAALGGLYRLAHHAALWTPSEIEHLVRDSQHARDREKVMQVLVECPAICAAAGSPQAGTTSALRQYCSEAIFSTDLEQAATAAHILTTIVVHCYEESLPVEGSELMLALESLVVATGADSARNIRPLRVALQCLVKLSTAEPVSYSGRSAVVVTSQLGGINWRGDVVRGCALLEALAALAGAPRTPPGIVQPPRDVIATMQRQGCIENPADDGTALVLACTVILQERAASALKCKLQPTWQQHLLNDIDAASGWVRYRVARAALRYGHVRLGASILWRLQGEAASEAVQRWLIALHKAASADDKLLQEGISGVEECSSVWESAAGWAGSGAGWCAAGCGGCGACTARAGAWLAARAGALLALARLAAAARALTTQPPPAIAHAHAQALRDPAAKSGACSAAIRGASRALSAAADRYAAIARTAFHTDDSTLRHFYISQQTYKALSQLLDRITSPTQERGEVLTTLTPRSLEERIALTPYDKLVSIENKLFDNLYTQPGITHRHYEAILACVRACCQQPALWPRGVFSGRSCNAACRLSVWPAPEHPPPLPLSHRLAVKLEGVVLPPTLTSKRQKPRQVKGVQITVTATPHPRTNEKTVDLTNVPPILTAVQTVTPVRDFFSAAQLVSVPAAGFYTVAVDAAFVDEQGELWNTGPRTSLVVKAHEELTPKGNTQTARGGRF